MLQRRSQCGVAFKPLALAMRHAHEKFVSERQAWQRLLAPEMRACARHAATFRPLDGLRKAAPSTLSPLRSGDGTHPRRISRAVPGT